MLGNSSGGSAAIEKFLAALVEEMAIPEPRYEQAETSYRSLGEWLHRPASKVRQFDPTVYVQGSFRLGTAIRPVSDAEDYDVDTVCELRLNKSQLSQYQLKQLLGEEVKAYHDAKNMNKPVREGRRCWILDYADGAQFHMDLLPALPNGAEQRLLLERALKSTSWSESAVAITDKEEPTYFLVTANWPRSNPKGYGNWFNGRMAVVLQQRKKLLVESLQKRGFQASVETMPDYRVRTPLQAAVMLLKRHRDHMFANEIEIKPISVIISTLAAHAYGQEGTIAEALASILANMDRYIFWDGQTYQIQNPTDPLENFADRWKKDPRKAQAFFDWLKQTRADFGRLARSITLQDMNEAVSKHIGVGLTERAVRKIGLSGSGGLLRAATAAPAAAASAPSFGNAPRIPTTPKGFA